MAIKVLTDRAIKSFKPGPVRREVADAGCRGLYHVIQPSDARSWAFRYRFGGKSCKLTLDPRLSLADARVAATEAARKVAKGHDPAQDKRADQAKAADTVRSVSEAYLEHKGGELRSIGQRIRLLGKHVYKVIGDRPITAVRRSEIVRLLDKIEKGSGARTAQQVLASLRVIFNWYALRTDDYVPPFVKGMGRVNAKERQRSRILSDEEIRAVWAAAAELGTFGRLVRFLLLTGCRRGEAAGMRWDEVVGDVFTLPAERSKTKLPVARPLSRAALATLEGLPHVAGCPFPFTADFRRPIASFSKPKRKLDHLCGVTDWHLHDLRRTSRSLLSRAGIGVDTAERCLGHTIGGVRGVYDRHRYVDEMRHAFEALAMLIEGITDPRENVISIRR
jgi:integrase